MVDVTKYAGMNNRLGIYRSVDATIKKELYSAFTKHCQYIIKLKNNDFYAVYSFIEDNINNLWWSCNLYDYNIIFKPNYVKNVSDKYAYLYF